ncbi:MAG: prepilin-type N-terminal cleavage/methylation domain-containing protein [Planctomycetota bacterium]|nr:prepilin-type N-terminal cleavage/methylation domain-containing protein [Planctomycetota bacterium]
MSKSLRAYRSKQGFSLLELMIVLVLMVGLLAIAWPNMQRSLRRTTLNEAAQMLREAIDEGRHEAIVTGRPVFVQMQQGNHEVRTGSFANFANDEDTLGSVGNGLDAEVVPIRTSPLAQQQESHMDSKSPRKWRLPESVVIAEVNWTNDFALESDNESGKSPLSDPSASHSTSSYYTSSHHSSNHLESGSNGQSDSSPSSATGADEMLSLLDGSQSDWWLPISATGQSRSASIVLYDKTIHEKMTITYASDTGSLEIVK